VAAALQIWSPTFSAAFDSLPAPVRDAVQRKIDDMGTRLKAFPHDRLQGAVSSDSEWVFIAFSTNSTLTKAESFSITSATVARFI